jgi:hypothetical protein
MGFLIDNKKRNNKPLVAKQKKIAVLKTSYDSNEDQYKSRSRSMSNLPLNKLEELREKAHKQSSGHENDGICSKGREKPYNVKSVQNWIKQKRLESKQSKEDMNERKVKERSYDQKLIREYMDKQKELRRKQLEFDRDSDKVVKCERKSYDPLVARKYMVEKKKKQKQQLLVTDNNIKIDVKESGNKTQENNNNDNRVQNDSNSKFSEVIDKKSVNNNSNNVSVNEKVSETKSDNKQQNNSVLNNKSNSSLVSSPTKSPTKGHRRQEPIMNSEHLKEMLTQLINGSGDPVAPLADYKSLPNSNSNHNILKELANNNHIKPISVIKMPDYSSMNGSLSAISCLTNSIGTNDELSPLTLSPNSSLLSKSISLKSEDIDFAEKNDNLIETSIKQVIDRAVIEVPTWEQLCERVYKTSFKNKTLNKSVAETNSHLVETQITTQLSPRQSSPVSPKSSKAMEVFPHFKSKTPKTQINVNQKPKFIEQKAKSLSPQRTPSPVFDSIDDSLKSLASLSSSSTSTPSTTKSATPAEVIVDLSLVDKVLDNSNSISSPIIEEIRSNSNANSYSSNFESNSPSSCSLSLNSNTITPKELSVLERVGKIRKEHNLSNGELTDTSINRSTKLSQHDLFRLTSDIEDIDDINDGLEDDATDNVSSIKSEEDVINSISSSKSQTITCEKPSKPELIVDLNINEFIRNESINIFRAKRTIESIKQLEYRHKNRTPFKLFLFELCKEITLEQFSFDDDFKITLKLPLKLQKQLWPKSEEEFASIMTTKVKELIEKTNVKPNIRTDGLMGYCRKSKKRDLVDTVLYEEICLEDSRWAYFEPEILIIKHKITDMIVDQLISEAIHQWKIINK